MPDQPDDLPDDLRALLADRAEHAPAVPAPTGSLVRRVRRRQAARATAAVSACAAGVVAVVGLAAAARPAPTAVPPAATPSAPAWPDPAHDDRYEFCTRPPTYDVHVAVHATETKFAHGCYRVLAGATQVRFTNPQNVPHDLVITAEGAARPLFTSALITTPRSPSPSNGVAGVIQDLPAPLRAGDYTLTCRVHPAMHAQLVVR